MDLKLLVHAYCQSSYKVVKYLVEKGLHSMIEIVPLNPGNPMSLTRVVPSVPALAYDDRMVAVDPIEPEFIEAILLGKDLRRYVPVAEHEVVERFVNSARSSSYVMLHMLLGGLSFGELVSSEFTEMAARTYFSGLSGDYVRGVLMRRSEAVEAELAAASIRSAAYSFLRDVVVSTKGSAQRLVDYEVLRLWATAKLSHGVSYIPLRGSPLDDRVKKLLDYVSEHYDKISKSIEDFLGRLSSDAEVYTILTSGTRPGKQARGPHTRG